MFKILPFLFIGSLFFSPNLEASGPKNLGDEVKNDEEKTHFVIKLGSPNEEKEGKTPSFKVEHLGVGVAVTANKGDEESIGELVSKLSETDLVKQSLPTILNSQEKVAKDAQDSFLEMLRNNEGSLSNSVTLGSAGVVIDLSALNLGEIDSSSEKK